MSTEAEIKQIKTMLDQAENSIRQAKNLLFSTDIAAKASAMKTENSGSIVEGIFDGEKMASADKKHYDVPANYASKSKLVVGDMMKLIIQDDGSFVYKQIGPVERKKMIGTLSEISAKNYVVICGKTEYRVLPASVTYFKASDGDKLTILVPKDSTSEWAAVENLIGKLERGNDGN